MQAEPPTTTQSFVKFELEHIMPIPESERRGTKIGLFAIWFGLNMMPLTVVTGAVASASYGLPIGWSIAAILLGNLLGGFGAALHASQGPHLGIPQMLQARGQFGFQGASLFAFIALVMFIGFFASILIVAKESIALVFPDANSTFLIIIFAAIGTVICIFGYDLLQKMMTYVSILIGITVIVSLVLIWMKPEMIAQQGTAAFNAEGFFAMVAVGVVWQLAYAPYVSDYTRYLPSTTGPRNAFWMTYIGLVASSVFVMILGVLLGAANPENPLAAIGENFGGIGVVILWVFAITSILINGVELYSGVMNGLTVYQSSLRNAVVTTRTRVVMSLVVGTIATVIALLGQGDFMTTFENFLTLLLYALIPWSAVNLADYFIVVKGEYKISDLFKRDGGVYGRWNWIALLSYAIGLIVQIPFMVTPFFTSPIAQALRGIDIAWLVGFIVTAVIYLVLSKATHGRGRWHTSAANELHE